ncbi:unnamed protein product [Zymoseptoria tritici ST99CH_3D7]|uniref:Uncharacterized protein n=1 Tax=Zymoseptoria tritici (strain ST99CH_3D7) TaxID=1276538 RepID=A0A1X7RNU6_ZYMT9|nr:unnamed protein product [Zymoseptoria tritici ST99CH_3D7]
MPQREDITTPQLERGDAFSLSPSPARDALQGNLDNTLSLTHKKSWFGSARETLSRGALSAKGYIDALRGETSSRAGDDSIFEDPTDAILAEEDSVGDSAQDTSSLTPLRPCSDRQRSFTPKTAMTSLRHHVHMSSRSRQKRGALAEITGNEVQSKYGGAGAENFDLEDQDSEDTSRKGESNDLPAKGHGRKSSLGKSLVGSIRRMTTSPRSGSPARMSRPSPTKAAAEVPLPSSPINIPAPSLSLDLEHGALMPSNFGQSPPETRADGLIGLATPGNATTIKSPTFYICVATEGPLNNVSSTMRKPVSPFADFLADESGIVPQDHVPTTPMPGSTFNFELDGAKMEATSELFERSVDRAGKKTEKSLKRMISLDGIAKQGNGNSVETTDSVGPGLLGPGVPKELRHESSLTTIESCPTDMPNLTRQLARLQDPEAGHRDPKDGEWKSDDPFAPGNVIGDVGRSPSSDRDIKLPFRPKIMVHAVDSLEPRTTSDEPTVLNTSTKVEDVAVYQLSKECVSHKHGEDADDCKPWPVYRSVAEELHVLKSRTNFRDSELSGSGDYDDFNIRHMFPALIDLDDVAMYDDARSDGVKTEPLSGADTEDSSRSPVQLMSNVYKRISTSQTPSSGRSRASTTHSTDVGDVFWNFAVRDWVQAGPEGHCMISNEGPSPIQAIAERSQRSSDQSQFDRTTPDVSPSVSSPGIGSRLEHDLKRSNRNMRYNALFDSHSTPRHECDADASEVIQPLRPNLQLVTGNLANGSKSSISLIGYVPNNSSESDLGSKGDEASDRCERRNDSLTQTSEELEKSLQQAIAEHYVFQVAMAGMGMGEQYEDLPDLPTSASTAAAGSEFHYRQEGYESLPSSAISPGGAQCKSDVGLLEEGYNDEDEDVIHDFDIQVTNKGQPKEVDTLDEALEMFRTYSHSQQELHEQYMASENGADEDATSPVREGSCEAASSPSTPSSVGKNRLPARYHSQRGRKN